MRTLDPADFEALSDEEKNRYFADAAREFRDVNGAAAYLAERAGDLSDYGLASADIPPPNGPGDYGTAQTVADDGASKGTNGGGEGGKPPSRVMGAGTFIRSYQPISYTIDGILPSGYLYGITAKQGSGKTAFMITAALAVVLGNKDILGCEVEKGRVAYVTIENPTDFKMKLAVNCYIHNVSYDEIEPLIAIIDGRDTPRQIYDGLKLDAEKNGPFQLVCFDTFQAGFAAANAGAFNDNEAVLGYVIRLRPLTTLAGLPSVLVAFHPTKNAGEGELIPYGGGSTYNEVDGNLTLWKETQIKLYHNRLRGPEFEPRFFRIEMLSCNSIVDKKGRQILLPVMRPTTAADVDARKQAAGDTNIALLKAIALGPKATAVEWARAIGLSRQAVHKKLQDLKIGKFVERGADDRWRLTKKGRGEIITLLPDDIETER